MPQLPPLKLYLFPLKGRNQLAWYVCSVDKDIYGEERKNSHKENELEQKIRFGVHSIDLLNTYNHLREFRLH